jgi:hypothetical protein
MVGIGSIILPAIVASGRSVVRVRSPMPDALRPLQCQPPIVPAKPLAAAMV